MIRMLATTMMAFGAVIAVSALAYAEETIIEKHTYESQKNTVETVPVVPEVKQKVVEERTVTTEQPVVQKRTDTVVTTTHEKHDDDND
jgi:hypothetical protein